MSAVKNNKESSKFSVLIFAEEKTRYISVIEEKDSIMSIGLITDIGGVNDGFCIVHLSLVLSNQFLGVV